MAGAKGRGGHVPAQLCASVIRAPMSCACAYHLSDALTKLASSASALILILEAQIQARGGAGEGALLPTAPVGSGGAKSNSEARCSDSNSGFALYKPHDVG